MLESNELYKQIEAEKDTYEIASVNAIIEGDYIIPGLNGHVVDVKDSYYNMKDLILKNKEEVAKLRGKSVEEILG